MTCPLCRKRKGRRACPALGRSICSRCCGTKRRVEVDCPPDCTFLLGSHAEHWEGRETERRRDARHMAPLLHDLDEAQQTLFLRVMVGVDWLASEAPRMGDRVALDVVSTLRKTQETRARGVIYDHAPEDARVAPLVERLGTWLRAPAEESLSGPRDADLAVALAAVESLAKDVLREAGPTSTELLALAARLAAELPDVPRPSEPAPPSSPLITL